jgi:hypothetical protein
MREIPQLIEQARVSAPPGREAVVVNEILRAVVRELQQRPAGGFYRGRGSPRRAGQEMDVLTSQTARC